MPKYKEVSDRRICGNCERIMKIEKKKIIIGVFTAVLIIVGVGIWWLCIENAKTDSNSIISEMTKERPDAVVTVGVWKDGDVEYHVYGENGTELPAELHTYAIGSITKTFTGSLIAKEVSEGKLDVDQGIGAYVSLSNGAPSPSIKSLMTHTSGLTDQWEQALEEDMDVSFSREEMLALLEKQQLSDNNEPYYSNFGSALAGTTAAAVENLSYEEAMNRFVREELQLEHTKVGGSGDFGNNWNWKSGDEMMADGAITSNVTDMLTYGRMHLENKPFYLGLCHQPLAAFSEDYDCGYFWLIDKENGIIWHNGEVCTEDENGNLTGYQAFLGFAPEKNCVAVVLSNMISYDKDENAYTDLLGYALLLQDMD